MKRLSVYALLLVACGAGDATSSTTDPGAASTAPPAGGTTSPPPSPTAPPAPAPVAKGPPPSALPAGFLVRPDVGTPLTPQELEAATDKLVALLTDMRYFDVVDERLHGWPETSPGYSYATWWSGVTVTKQGGVVTYKHGAGGADNNGLRTAPLLESACWAHLLWAKPVTARLVRRMVRGYSSWALGMKRSAGDTIAPMLSRAHYPVNVTSTEQGRTIVIDYSLNRPGEDGASTDYVHLPTNPTFGDIWIKNKRSKDDMGQIFRSIAQVDACTSRLDAAGQADIAEMRALYKAWSAQVEADGYGIQTLDKNAQPFMPPTTETLAHYTTSGNLECSGAAMMSLLAHGNTGSLSCGNGISSLEQIAAVTGQLKNDARQILRTHHEAAMVIALAANQTTTAQELAKGLVSRVESDLALAMQTPPPAKFNPDDVVALLLHAAATGVPLTSKEVRWIHERLGRAHASYRAPSAAATYKVFDPSTPDGTYAYEPGGDGMFFQDIALVLGSCASPWRNETGRAVVDCKKLLAAFP